MKTLHLLIIIITATMVSLVSFGTYVIVHPIIGGITPSSTNKGYIQIDTPGLEKVYEIGQPIDFSVLIQGFGLYPCQPTEIIIYNNTQTKPVFHYSTQGVSCPSPGEHYRYYFPDQNNTFSVTINQTGIYTLDVSLGKDSYQKEFSVLTPKTTIYDSGILPSHVNVFNTNFTINYSITGNNTLLDAKLDKSQNTLALSLVTSSNGILTITVPRALLDPKNAYSNQDAQFIVLANEQEVKYTETTSMTARTLTMPVEVGTKKIEIIAPQSI